MAGGGACGGELGGRPVGADWRFTAKDGAMKEGSDPPALSSWMSSRNDPIESLASLASSRMDLRPVLDGNGVTDLTRPGKMVRFCNCKLFRNRMFVTEDLWVRFGKIIDPQTWFFEQRKVVCPYFDASST